MNCCALALYLGDVMIFFCMIRTAGFNRDTESRNRVDSADGDVGWEVIGISVADLV